MNPPAPEAVANPAVPWCRIAGAAAIGALVGILIAHAVAWAFGLQRPSHATGTGAAAACALIAKRLARRPRR